MTSGPTRKPTEEFFEKNNYFGLDKANVMIFEQGVLPCISNDGKILLENKAKAAVAPDGNGGIYQALVVSGVREDMRKRGIQHIHLYGVDNCLVKVADPVFIGFSASLDVDIATKVVRKRNATESVGLILLKNGKPDVVEYSEIDTATAEAKDPKQPDVLKYRAANIVNHYYSFRFLESIENWAHQLPHHVARKKIPFTDAETGDFVKPEKPNGVKLEQFVFDVFPMTPLDKFASIEVRREDEFSPLKNARGTGEDDPDTSRDDIMAQGQRWVEAAGGIVITEGEAKGVEVSPLISYVCSLLLLLGCADADCYRVVKTWNSLREGKLRHLLFWNERSRFNRDWNDENEYSFWSWNGSSLIECRGILYSYIPCIVLYYAILCILYYAVSIQNESAPYAIRKSPGAKRLTSLFFFPLFLSSSL